MESATSISYSSSANLGPGYDILAVAHDAYHDRVSARLSSGSEKRRIRILGMKEPHNPLDNTAGLAVDRLLHDMELRDSVDLSIMKGVPAGLGLGSSGASASAAISAVDRLLGLNLSKEEKVKYSMFGEIASSGTPHADNVAASIFGGLVVVESINPIRVRHIPISQEFSFLTVIPAIHIADKTRICRTLVPGTIPMDKYVENARYIAELTSGLITGDRELVRSGMNDSIVEVARKPLYPFYDDLKKIMLDANAAGACLSGAGPSVIAVVDERTRVEEIIDGSRKYLQSVGIQCNIVMSRVSGGAYTDGSS